MVFLLMVNVMVNVVLIPFAYLKTIFVKLRLNDRSFGFRIANSALFVVIGLPLLIMYLV